VDPSGKVALVTGAGKRVGRSLAIALGEAGCRVAVHYGNSGHDAEETASFIRDLGTDAITVQADLENPVEIERAVTEVVGSVGPVEILVNNASIFEKVPLNETDVELWDRHFAVNARAPFLLAQGMSRTLPADSLGKIINLNDWRTARPTRFAYGVSKSALSGLTRSLAVALAPSIQVNEISLGAILPPSDIPVNRPRDQIQTDLGPADRMGTLEEVSQAMMMLISNDFITGESIFVDGGRHIY
jgi:pteridine reductase